VLNAAFFRKKRHNPEKPFAAYRPGEVPQSITIWLPAALIYPDLPISPVFSNSS
jgi:hypothetical protein